MKDETIVWCQSLASCHAGHPIKRFHGNRNGILILWISFEFPFLLLPLACFNCHYFPCVKLSFIFHRLLVYIALYYLLYSEKEHSVTITFISLLCLFVTSRGQAGLLMQSCCSIYFSSQRQPST